MPLPDRFHIAAKPEYARAAAERLFAAVQQQLVAVLPKTCELLHIGATSVPGCLTKGDLDIVVRVERKDFQATEAALAARYARNSGSVRTNEFAAFEDDASTPISASSSPSKAERSTFFTASPTRYAPIRLW